MLCWQKPAITMFLSSELKLQKKKIKIAKENVLVTRPFLNPQRTLQYLLRLWVVPVRLHWLMEVSPLSSHLATAPLSVFHQLGAILIHSTSSLLCPIYCKTGWKFSLDPPVMQILFINFLSQSLITENKCCYKGELNPFSSPPVIPCLGKGSGKP